MIGITGHRSTITQALLAMLPDGEVPVWDEVPNDCGRYFFCAGVLHGKRVSQLPATESHETWDVNFAWVAEECDRIIDGNPNARICVMGSESGFAGSYDMAYAGAKAALHLYVETKRLRYPGQQLVAIAPTIIEDSAMTQRRGDLDACLARGRQRRMGRWLRAENVARMVHHALYVDDGSLCNVVIRMNGGVS